VTLFFVVTLFCIQQGLYTTAVMSNLRDPHASDGQDTPLTVPPKSRKKCLVLSLIRHGQVCHLLFLILNHLFNLGGRVKATSLVV